MGSPGLPITGLLAQEEEHDGLRDHIALEAVRFHGYPFRIERTVMPQPTAAWATERAKGLLQQDPAKARRPVTLGEVHPDHADPVLVVGPLAVDRVAAVSQRGHQDRHLTDIACPEQ